MPKHSSTIPSGPSRKVAWFRLERHHLLDAKPADAVAISRDVCGIQAQVGSAAQMALWARNHDLRRTEIEAALWQKRSLVKTSLMRQTLHLIPADEFSLYTTALKSSRVSGALRIMARFGITREEAAEVTTMIMDSLSSERWAGLRSAPQFVPKSASECAPGWKESGALSAFPLRKDGSATARARAMK